MDFLIDSSFIYIDSSYRNSSDSINKINVNLATSFLAKPNEYFVLSVNSAEIYFSWYSCNTYNNELIIEVSDALGDPVETITDYLTPCSYNSTTMITELTGIFTDNGYSVTITYDRFTGKFTFSTTSEFKFVISGTSHELLGIPSAGSDQFYSGTDYTGDYLALLSGDEYIYIRSNLSSVNQYEFRTGLLTDILVKIPVDVSPMSLINFRNFYGASGYKVYQKTINNFTLSLTDSVGHDLDMNGINWSLTLKLDKYKNVNQPDELELGPLVRKLLTIEEQQKQQQQQQQGEPEKKKQSE